MYEYYTHENWCCFGLEIRPGKAFQVECNAFCYCPWWHIWRATVNEEDQCEGYILCSMGKLEMIPVVNLVK